MPQYVLKTEAHHFHLNLNIKDISVVLCIDVAIVISIQ